MITLNLAVTPREIQPKNVRTDSNPNNQNRIRRAWVLVAGDELAAVIKAKMPVNEIRWAYYDALDEAVNIRWIEIMRAHKESAIKAGAEMVLDKIGGDRLEDAYCLDADEHLIQAAIDIMSEVAIELQ